MIQLPGMVPGTILYIVVEEEIKMQIEMSTRVRCLGFEILSDNRQWSDVSSQPHTFILITTTQKIHFFNFHPCIIFSHT